MASLGCHVVGFAPPHANPWGLSTTLLGVCARAARLTPEPDIKLFEEFTDFVFHLIRRMFPTKISLEKDMSVEWWLSTRPYTQSRKLELLEKWRKCNGILERKHFFNKCFMKDETYATWKHARGIYSRSDEFKCYSGPIASAIEEIVFAHPAFIKHVPVLERPGLLMETLFLPGAKYLTSDYTAFESHFTRMVMHNVEFMLYRYLCEDLPGYSAMLDVIESAITGRNRCEFKHFRMDVDATRMSGEMFTSLGNGFTNYALMAFAAHKHGTTMKGFVEGDDGIFVFDRNVVPESSFFERLGWTIKIEVHSELNKASFCGNIFDVDDLIVVTDPRDVLLNFGWSKTPYVNAKQTRLLELLKSKSLSYAYQYRGCPIIQSLAHYGLRTTRRIDLRRFLAHDRSISMWEKEQLLEAINHSSEIEKIEVPLKTRMLVSELYGITIEDQKKIEEYLDGLDGLQPLSLPLFETLFTREQAQYWCYYVDDGCDTMFSALSRDCTWMDVYGDQIRFTREFFAVGARTENIN